MRSREETIDHAAGLYARHGLTDTALDRAAYAVTLAGTGLLRHFPTRELLVEAALGLLGREVAAITRRAAAVPPGRERDLAVVSGCVDVALRRPGVTALSRRLALSGVTTAEGERQEHALLAALGVEDGDPVRLAGVGCALGGLRATAVAVAGGPDAERWRGPIVAAAMRTLGHAAPAYGVSAA